MDPELGNIGSLFERLAADPKDLVAFEDYARAVEAASQRSDPDATSQLAATLTEHLEKLPALAESRLQEAIDRVKAELLSSLELQELRPGKALEAAVESARSKLASRYPRVRGMSPEEFVMLNRSSPHRIADYLETCQEEWLANRLERCRTLLRDAGEAPGDAALASQVAGAMAELGSALLDAGALAFAEVAFRTALVYDPGQAEARAGLGHLARSYGRLREAELELRAALDRDPRHLDALAGIGEICLHRDRRDEAEAIAARLLAAHPEQPEGHVLAARLALLTEEPRRALPPLLEALDLDPDRPETFRLLSMAYARLGHGDLARDFHDGLLLRLGRDARPPEEPEQADATVDLPAELRSAAPPPPVLDPGGRDGGDLPADEVGPLTRREAYRRLLLRCVADDEHAPDMGPALKARIALRISREVFDALLDEALATVQRRGRPPPPFDPVEYFEELRRAAWRDGFLSPAERRILEDVLRCLGIDRRRGRRRAD